MRDGFESSAAGVGDRAWRQSLDHIGVVGRLLADVGLEDRTIRRFAVPTEETVDDRRVGLQAHALVQAVDENRGDMRALVVLAGFLLDDGGQRDELFLGLDRQIRIALLPDLVDQALLRRAHLGDDLGAVGAAGELVGIGAQAALRRQFGRKIAFEHRIGGKPLEHLLDRQAFRKGQPNRGSTCRIREGGDLLHRGARLDLVFAGLQGLTVLQIGGRDIAVNASVGDDAIALEVVGDLGEASAAAHDEIGVRRERTGFW